MVIKRETKTTVRQIIIFAALVNVLGWLGPVLGGSPTEPGLGLLVWGVAPIVSALIMRFVLRDKVSLGFGLKLRGNGRYYLLSLLFYPVIILLVLVLGLLLGASTISSFTGAEFMVALMPIAITSFIFGFFEEVGWRGYLAPKVAEIHTGLLGHTIVGLIWASWHFPYLRELWGHTSEGMTTLLPRFILGTIIAAIVYGEIRMRTRSVWPAVLMHGIGNTVANTLLAGTDGAALMTLVPGKEWLSSFGIEGVIMIALSGLLAAVLYRKRHNLKLALTHPTYS
ncbi:type II CAAX prenyl endopeptidase Rce1 family protein [Candidatus Leptofilum sp.]|uniref:CPBP family glutamic-type intramembrane protease n=1 Tax=Candidatus Leptofilum sp. TaxID=3241576 RepID=UPI003B5B7D6A